MKHLHEEAQLIGSMCLGKPLQGRHTADEQAGIHAASRQRSVLITVSSPNLNYSRTPQVLKSALQRRHMSKKPSYRRRGSRKLSFVCLHTYRGSVFLRLTDPSAKKRAGPRGNSASQGPTPSPLCPEEGGGGRGQGGQVFASQPRGHRPFSWPRFFIYSTLASVGPFTPKTPPPSIHPHPHLHQVVCYDFVIIYGALSGCACTFTTPSWTPLITGPRRRQSWRDGGAC